MNPGPQELEVLIEQLMSPDNAVRAAAETTYNTWKQVPDILLVAVLQVLMNSKFEQYRSMCIILLRGLLVRTTTVWAATSPPIRQRVCSELLVVVVNENNPVLRQKLNILIAEIGARLVHDGQWPELIPFLQASFESQIDSKKESALIIFGELASSLGSYFVPFYPNLKNNLHTGLCDPSLNVRIAALLATSNFLQGFFKPEHRAIFAPLVPFMIETVKAILTAKKEEEAQNALKLLVQIAESEPLFIQPCVTLVVDTMLAIANSNDFEEDTRHLACEILLTLAESKPAMMRKIPTCSAALIQIAFTLLLSLDDVPLDEWNKVESDDDDSGMENYDYGEEYLNRLSLALGGRTIVPQLFPIVNKLLENKQDWKHRYCAAMSVSIIGEGCVKTLSPHLSDILKTIVPLLSDPHPKVRWAACNCIGQMSTDFGPKLQKNFDKLIIPALAAVMDDQDNPRTRGHAAAALVNFVELWEQEQLVTYLEPLLGKLFGLLQSGNLIVQQHAVIAVAAIAEMAEAHFVKYRDVFMPNLLQVVVQCKGKEHRKLRGLAIECISMIGVAVGKEQFNGNEVMQILMREQALSVDYDDPQRPYIEQAMVRLCGCLKKDFTPYIATVLPPIMRIAEKSDIVVSDEQQESQDGWEYILLPTKQGEKYVGIRTASLDEKASACELIVAYAKALGGDFFSYVDPVVKLMLPLLKFYYTEDVRAAAAECMPALLESAAEYTKAAGAAAGADAMYVRNLFSYMFTTFVEAMEQELEPEILNIMLVAFVQCLDAAGDNSLDDQKLQRVSELVINLFKDYQEFIEEQKGKLEDIDEEEEERMSEEISNYEDVIANVADAIGRVGKHHNPDSFLAIFQPVLKFILEFIKPTARIAERHIAVCVVDDIIDNGGQGAFSLFPIVMPYFLEYILDKDPAIRQAVAFGLGIFTRVGKQHFLSFVPSVLPRLQQACALRDASSEEFEAATDNAISAIGVICATYGNSVDLATILPAWLHYLPMRADTEEALVVYNHLCDFVQQAGPLILGNEYQHLPKFVALVAEIIDTNFVDQELTNRFAAIIKGISSLPQDLTQKTWATLSAEAQAKLQKLLS